MPFVETTPSVDNGSSTNVFFTGADLVSSLQPPPSTAYAYSDTVIPQPAGLIRVKFANQSVGIGTPINSSLITESQQDPGNYQPPSPELTIRVQSSFYGVLTTYTTPLTVTSTVVEHFFATPVDPTLYSTCEVLYRPTDFGDPPWPASYQCRFITLRTYYAVPEADFVHVWSAGWWPTSCGQPHPKRFKPFAIMLRADATPENIAALWARRYGPIPPGAKLWTISRAYDNDFNPNAGSPLHSPTAP